MSKVIYPMSMSADGFVRARNATPEEPLGHGGEQLHDWAFKGDETNQALVRESLASIGVVVGGRRTYDDSLPFWGTDGPTGTARLPLFTVTHAAPDTSPDSAVYHFATSVAAAIEAARAAAGGRGVSIIGGPDVARQAIELGLVDEMVISVVPVLFGGGLRIFEGLSRHVQLEPLGVIDTPLATHIRYRVVR